jgi:PAS domain S-box-containing protein
MVPRRLCSDPEPDFRALFEAAPGLYLVLRPDLTIVGASDAYLSATMTRREEILGRGIFDVFPDNPDDPGATGVSNLRASLERVLHHRKPDTMAVQKYDVRRPAAEGGGFEERYWSPVNSPVLDADGKVAWIIHRVEDVTEFVHLKQRGTEQQRETEDLRLRAERMEEEIYRRAQELQESNRALRESEDRLRRLNETLEQRVHERTEQLDVSEQRYRHVVDLIQEGIWIHVDGRIIFANQQAAKMLGAASPDKLIGRPVMSLIHPDDRNRAIERTRQVIEDLKPLPLTDMKIVRLDGQTIIAELHGIPFVQGGDVHVIASGRDVTAQREAEMRLRQAQKMEAVGQLTGGIAHDFNNLLAVIIGNLQLLEKPLQDDARLQGRLKLALEAARSGAELTRRLLAFSRRQVLEPKIVQPNDLLMQMVPLMKRTLGEAIRLDVRLADDIWPVKVDTSHLESAVLNLAINARDAMPEGGRISIATATVTLDSDYAVTRSYVSPGRYVMIAVSDTGTGMTPDIIKRAFEPFFTTKETGKGSGLGLSMVYGFVKQSGGHIELYSEPGHGTTVKIYLPRVEAEADIPTESLPNRHEQPTGTERILVVDDNASVRATAVSMLESLGYEVLEAEDGNAALKVLAGSPGIDMVFSDIVMPGSVNGFVLAAEVRKRFPRTRVLLTSGFADIGSRSAPSIQEDLAWIGKPYEFEALARKLREVLSAGATK